MSTNGGMTEPVRTRSGWYVLGLAILVGAAAYGSTLYDRLPARIPHHWDGAGRPDGWSSRSVPLAFTPVLVGLVVVTVTWLCTRWLPDERTVGPHTAQATRDLLAATGLGVALAMAGGAVVSWDAMLGDGRLPAWTTWATVAGVLLLVVASLWLTVRANRLDAALADHEGWPRPAQSDPSSWRWGVVYANRDDRRVLVPKRLGAGYTVNMATPVGAVIGTLAGVAALAGLVVAVVSLLH